MNIPKGSQKQRDASGDTGKEMHRSNVFHDSPAQSWGKILLTFQFENGLIYFFLHKVSAFL